MIVLAMPLMPIGCPVSASWKRPMSAPVIAPENGVAAREREENDHGQQGQVEDEQARKYFGQVVLQQQQQQRHQQRDDGAEAVLLELAPGCVGVVGHVGALVGAFSAGAPGVSWSAGGVALGL